LVTLAADLAEGGSLFVRSAQTYAEAEKAFLEEYSFPGLKLYSGRSHQKIRGPKPAYF